MHLEVNITLWSLRGSLNAEDALWEHFKLNNDKTKAEWQICYLIQANHSGTTHMNKNEQYLRHNKSLLWHGGSKTAITTLNWNLQLNIALAYYSDTVSLVHSSSFTVPSVVPTQIYLLQLDLFFINPSNTRSSGAQKMVLRAALIL